MRTKILNIGQLVTMAGPEGPRRGSEMGRIEVVEGAGIVIDGGTVAHVGPTSEVEGHMADETVDAERGVVLPGFVDAHTHIVFAGQRAPEFEMRTQGKSYQEIAAGGGGIRNTVRATWAATESDLAKLTARRLDEALSLGTTTLEAKSGYGLTDEAERKILRVVRDADGHKGMTLVPTFLGLHATPPNAEADHDAYVRHMIEDVLPSVATEGLARYADAFIEDGYFTHDDARLLAAKCRELGLGVRLHVDQLTDGGGARLAAESGAVTADHLEQTGPEGFKALAGSGTFPVLLPASVLGLGLVRYPDARGMIGAGLPVVLATDFNPGSSPTLSIPLVMSLACRLMKMTPAEALTAVTVNAAASLGLTDRGRLVPGQRADLSLWRLRDWREVAYWMDGPRPCALWTSGQRRSPDLACP
ncbi:MAG: imidazolonepropionase [Armatimonadetes bacterium]|nr:imidazolonepropionase [Armatimonadota bacterium]